MKKVGIARYLVNIQLLICVRIHSLMSRCGGGYSETPSGFPDPGRVEYTVVANSPNPFHRNYRFFKGFYSNIFSQYSEVENNGRMKSCPCRDGNDGFVVRTKMEAGHD
jgi:hypothetical protein